MAFEDSGLEVPEASELLKLWNQHRGDYKWDFPAKLEWPEPPPALKPRGHRHEELFYKIPELKEMPRVWFDRVQLKLWEAFPRYAWEAYTVDEMIIMEIIQWFHMQAHHHHTFMCIEGMSGMGNLSRSFQEENMPSLRLDRKYSSTCDLAVAEGTRNFVVATRLLEALGLEWLGVECSNWVFMSRSSTGRTASSPEGDESLAKVKEANDVRDKACFLLLCLFFSHRHFALEQPQSSMINATDSFAQMMKITSCRMVSFDHAAYEDMDAEWANADSDDELPPPKALKVFSTAPWVQQLSRRCNRTKKRQKLSTKDRKGGITGKGDELKQSEHYSRSFGQSVATLHSTWVREQVEQVSGE